MYLFTMCQALLIFQVAEAPGVGSQYVIMCWMTNHAYLLQPAATPPVAGHASKGTSSQDDSGSDSEGGEDGRTLGADFQEEDESNLPKYNPDGDLKPAAQESVMHNSNSNLVQLPMHNSDSNQV